MLTPILAALALAFQQPAVTPMTLDGGGRPVIAVSVNGGEPLDFVVDTAAQQHVVMPRLIDRLALEPMEGATSVQGASGQQATRLYALASLSSPAFSQDDVQAVGLPNGSATEAWGIVGMGGFAGRRLVFDRTAMTFAITPSGPADDMTAVPATVFTTFAIVEVLIDGTPVRAVVDSGAARTIANGPALAALGWAADDARLSEGRPVRGATEHRIDSRLGRIGELKLGPAAFADVSVTFSDLPVFRALGLADRPAMILGSDILSRLPAYAIDYPRRELQIRLETPPT